MNDEVKIASETAGDPISGGAFVNIITGELLRHPSSSLASAGSDGGDKKLKLYVWHGFQPDYSGGLAFAIAYTKAEAKAAVEKVYGRVEEWGKLRVHRIEAGRAETIGGGG